MIDLKPVTINLRNFLESNQCIDDDRWNHKNWNPCHNLLQTCRGSKSIYPVWIYPTDNLIIHLRTRLSINKLWSNKYDTHKSTIKKISIERRTWTIFYIKQRNPLKQTLMTPNQNPRHDKSKFTCLVWINPIDSLITHLRKILRINERGNDYCE